MYISPTYADLKEYPRSVGEILRQMKIHSIAMEDYVSQNKRPLKKCLEKVMSSHIYVCVFALSYGYIPEQDNRDHLSKTEL